MTTVRKCYYELLQVESTAIASEIKTQYYKLARQYHPDKNIGNEEEAEIIFKELQTAYEVLSNPQERAWYDSHKEQILRGGTDNDVSGLNLWPYFSRSCYSGFGEKQNNFYAVYETAFASIAAEEVKMGYSKDDIPGFGNAHSDYGHVKRFYNYWINFATRKNFSWTDIYKTTEAPNRLYRRLAEKENDKERKKSIREFNEIVRRLASFVKRQDPRVLKELEKQKNEKKEKEVTAQKEKANLHEHRRQAREEAHRAWLEEAYEEDDIPIDEEDLPKSEEEVLQFRCDVCKKTFKNVNQYKNHERSKKHKTNMQKFKKEITFDSNTESELEKNKDTIYVSKDPEPEPETNNTEELKNQNHNNENNVDNNETNNTNEQIEHSNSDDNNEVGEVDETWAALLHQFDGDNSDDSEKEQLSRMLKNEQNKNQKKKQKKQKPKQHEAILKENEEMVKKVFEKYEKVEKIISESNSPKKDSTENIQEPDNEENNEETEEVTDTPKKKRRRRKEKTVEDKALSQSKAIACGKCGRKFNTRNQLFVHIKSTGHALVK